MQLLVDHATMVRYSFPTCTSMQKMSSVFTAQAYRNSPERVGRQRSAMLNTVRLAVSTANGMAHVARLEKEFPGQVLGGLVKIVATLDNGVVWVEHAEYDAHSCQMTADWSKIGEISAENVF